MTWMYYTEINFLTWKIVFKLLKVIFFVKAAGKFRNLQINKVLNTDTNRVFPVPFKVMYISLRYLSMHSLRNNSTVNRSGYLYEVNQTFFLTNFSQKC